MPHVLLADDLPPSYTATAAPLPQKGGYSPVTVRAILHQNHFTFCISCIFVGSARETSRLFVVVSIHYCMLLLAYKYSCYIEINGSA